MVRKTLAIRLCAALLASTALTAAATGAAAYSQAGASPTAARVTSPESFFPQKPGTDYFLANYDQYESYLQRIAAESDRMKLESFGTSAEGRTQWMAIVSSPTNLANLAYYQDIAQRLARAEGLTQEQAAELARQGKAIVWIDAGLHATETVTTQGQIQILHNLLTQNDPETLRTLDDVIILFGHANPDGLQLVADWYMRNPDPQKREFNSIPRLYQKYVGHDNNRDSYMSLMPETRNINRVHYREWFPQIVFNQHQTGPRGMVVFIPPFRDPFNYNFDPLVMTTTTEVGTIMHSRLIAEGKAGSGKDSVAPYSTWHNGMYRSAPYFHNMVGILTEIIGGPTPEAIPLIPETQLARNDEPMPIGPRMWHLQDSIDYQWSMNRAVIDYASRNRERLLMGIYQMGANSIQRGSQDSWTITPQKVDALKAAATTTDRGAIDSGLFDSVLKTAENRDPRGFIINPAEQRDLPTTVAFLNALIRNGVDVDVASAPFTVKGKTYPAGSYVVKTAQAFRPHILDMFEPQDHPHNTEYPGGPPKLPYDVAGYTLAYQMGVAFDRVLDGFDGPFQRTDKELAAPAGSVIGNGRAGFLIPHEVNNSFILTNRLLKAGAQVEWLKDGARVGRMEFAPGIIWVQASPEASAAVRQAVGELGFNAYAVDRKPAGQSIALKPVRVGLVDRYGGVMSSGWTRWLLEQYEFPFEVVYPQTLDQEDLNAKYDVLVFTDGTTPALTHPAYRPQRNQPQPKAEDIPADFRGWLGEVSQDVTVPRLSAFVRNGGSVVTIGGANRLAHLMGAPIEPALVGQDGANTRPLTTSEFFLPGSILRASVDNRQPLAFGMPSQADIFFSNGQTYRFQAGDAASIAWFDSATPLRSGWAHNQERLKDTAAVVEVEMGKGKVFVYGAEVAQRAQPAGTFRLLFNGLLYGPAAAAD